MDFAELPRFDNRLRRELERFETPEGGLQGRAARNPAMILQQHAVGPAGLAQVVER